MQQKLISNMSLENFPFFRSYSLSPRPGLRHRDREQWASLQESRPVLPAYQFSYSSGPTVLHFSGFWDLSPLNGVLYLHLLGHHKRGPQCIPAIISRRLRGLADFCHLPTWCISLVASVIFFSNLINFLKHLLALHESFSISWHWSSSQISLASKHFLLTSLLSRLYCTSYCFASLLWFIRYMISSVIHGEDCDDLESTFGMRSSAVCLMVVVKAFQWVSTLSLTSGLCSKTAAVNISFVSAFWRELRSYLFVGLGFWTRLRVSLKLITTGAWLELTSASGNVLADLTTLTTDQLGYSQFGFSLYPRDSFMCTSSADALEPTSSHPPCVYLYTNQRACLLFRSSFLYQKRQLVSLPFLIQPLHSNRP